MFIHIIEGTFSLNYSIIKLIHSKYNDKPFIICNQAIMLFNSHQGDTYLPATTLKLKTKLVII